MSGTGLQRKRNKPIPRLQTFPTLTLRCRSGSRRSVRHVSHEAGLSLIVTVSFVGLAFAITAAAFLTVSVVGRNTARLAAAKVDIETREDVLMRAILQQTAAGMLPGTNGITGAPNVWDNGTGTTGIIPDAANALSAALYYVNPTEAATLLPPGVIPANLADTGLTGVELIQGYNAQGYNNSGTPFGGTSGLANLAPSYNASVEPPLMTWSGNTALSTTTALTTPQEFFLGSQYSALSSAVTKLSATKRWGRIYYPNIRFGYKRPGDPNFVARRVWWRIPILYQWQNAQGQTSEPIQDQPGVSPTPTQDQTVAYPAVTPSSAAVNQSSGATYVLSVYEIPSQLPISGNTNLQIGQNLNGGSSWASSWINFSGSNGTAGSTTNTCSIYANQVQLAGGTYNSVSAHQQLNITNSATVGGVTFTNSTFDNLGVREQDDLALSTLLTGTAQLGAAPVSVAGNDGKVLLVPVMPGAQFYMAAPNNAPTHWDLYARPYYKCRIRVVISGTNSNLIYNPSANPQINTAANTGAITVTITYLPDTTGAPDQILGFPDSSGTTLTYTQTSYYSADSPYSTASDGLPSYMTYTSTGAGTSPDQNVLVINISGLVNALGNPAQLYSIYIGSNPTSEPASPATASDPAIAITGTSNLTAFTNGLSLVSNQMLYFLDQFNQGPANSPASVPASVYAPDIRYGVSGVNPSSVALTGQIAIDPEPGATPSPTPACPLNFNDGADNPIALGSSSNTFSLNEIIDPTKVPPITPLTLLFTIEKERTN
jgi:hypothetical protein